MSRFLLLASFTLALLAVVATADCGVAPGSNPYATPSSTTCSNVTSCVASLCNCTGLTRNGLTCEATTSTSRPTCSVAAGCIGNYIKCLNAAASSCTFALESIHTGLLAVEAGLAYNSSSLYQSCRYVGCNLLNATVGGSNSSTSCSLSNAVYGTLCVPTTSYFGALRINGQGFSQILSSPSAVAALKAALKVDLERLLQLFSIIMHGLTATTVQQRQTQEQLVAEFEVQGYSGSNPVLLTGIQAAAANSNWLTATLAEYRNQNGQGSLTAVGITSLNGTTTLTFQPPVATPSPGGSPGTPGGNGTEAPGAASGAMVSLPMLAVAVASVFAVILLA